MAYTLPALPFSTGDLEPFYDRATLELHHGKHHAGYVDNLNRALADYPIIAEQTVEELLTNLQSVPAEIRTAVTNNGGGHANHSLFWRTMGPAKETLPTGDLDRALNSSFGDIAKFKKLFANAASQLFGAGWTWLYVEAAGRLGIGTTQNQDSLLEKNQKPILALDLWEHAYYLKFHNRRADWIDAWWNIVDWAEVGRLHVRIMEGESLHEIYQSDKSHELKDK